MAILRDTSLDLGNVSSTSLTISYTNNGNILFVGVIGDTGISNTITGVTYGGKALTKIDEVQNPGDRWVSLWYLKSPPTGANNIVISNSASDFIQGLAVSYSGAGSIDVEGINSSASTTAISKTLTTTSNNDWTVALVASNGGGSPLTAGSSTTRVVNSTSFNQFALFDSNASIPTGNTTLNINLAGTAPAAIVMAAFAVTVSSPSASLSPSSSISPSASRSPSSSISASISPSASVSPSASRSPSSSSSASQSPSSSISASQSPSASISPSSSVSSSLSPSSSFSPSSSNSPSSSISASQSPSASISPSSSISSSVSPSASLSPSSSSSASMSPSSSVSSSISPSSSISSSVSPSPSIGFADYSRGTYNSLPVDDNDLQTLYTEQEVEDVDEEDFVIVEQTGHLAYMLHQFKNFVGARNFVQIEWVGQTTLAPNQSTVYIQIYNHISGLWDTVDLNDSERANKNFRFLAVLNDLTNYKDNRNMISCRVQQLAI